MNRLFAKKERIITSVIITLFILISCLSMITIYRLHGNARVVNYVGIVRGATQKLIKEELFGIPDDPLIARLDSIVAELTSGEGPNDLTVLPDDDYLHNMRQVQAYWKDIKAEIMRVRAGENNARLFELSEEYFNLADRAVSSAETFSERQVARSIGLLSGVNALFVVVLAVALVLYLRSARLKREADALEGIAYLDPLTKIPNRARCEQCIREFSDNPPDGDLAVFVFDMNNLKAINDQLGHQGGDNLIADFAAILLEEGSEYGFVGRYGGDEFLAVFPDADEERVLDYLSAVNERVVAYNLPHISDVHRIGFAVGHYIGNLREQTLPDMIHEADRRMYARKRQMKCHSDIVSRDKR